MPIEHDSASTRSTQLSVLGTILAILTLFVVLYYFYIYIRLPVPNFTIDAESGVVVHVSGPCPTIENPEHYLGLLAEPDLFPESDPVAASPPRDGSAVYDPPEWRRDPDPAGVLERPFVESCLELGDEVVRLGDLEIEDYLRDRTLPIYRPLRESEAVLVDLIRDGRPRHGVLVRSTHARGFISSFATLLFPLLFWAMGGVALLFLRPRDERWLLLVLFQFDTALWASSGFIAFSQEALSSVFFRMVIWPFLPLSIHLHLVLPDSPFRKYHRAILLPLYSCAAILIVMDQMRLVPRSVRLGVTLLAMFGTLTLLVWRQFVQTTPGGRIAARLMAYGVGLGLGPIIVLILIYLFDMAAVVGSEFATLMVAVFLLVSPLWPLTYIYAIYRNDQGTFEFRSNRLLGLYGFFSAYITLFIVAYNVLYAQWALLELDPAIFSLGISILFTASGPALYKQFQRLVDSRVFGIKYTHHELVSAFAAKIPRSFNRQVLTSVIVDEILPTLLIKQSALYELDQDKVAAVYEQDVPQGSFPKNQDEIERLAAKAGTYISFSTDSGRRYSWVRLVIPLSIQETTVGVWLLGRRDPDDFYSGSDIVLLTNLANQIAPVTKHVRLVEQARQEVLENRRLQQQLVHSQKMEAIGRLSAGVAHDFNNILSVIIGYSNLVLKQYGDDETLGQAIGNIKDAGERAAILTKQLLAFSRKQVMEIQLINLNRVVSDVEKMLGRLAGEDIELVTRLEPDVPCVRVDPGQMGQVIINLAVNARDAMPEGGRLQIETQRVDSTPTDGAIRHGVPPGDFVLLTVEDDGTGVSADIQARMFEPYFTTKEMGKGTGLGLSMVYGIIDQCGGLIFVDSEEGRGTRFSIYLPSVLEEAPGELLDPVRPMITGSGTEVILLVEDEESVREVTSEILRSSGYEVLVAASGEEALVVFRGYTGRIDLLLTDVVMPHMKGTELARRLLIEEPDLKIVYMSGYNEESILGRRIGEEGSILIQKPFSPHQLSSRVREVLDEGAATPESETTPGSVASLATPSEA